jgi:hypothetical protein
MQKTPVRFLFESGMSHVRLKPILFLPLFHPNSAYMPFPEIFTYLTARFNSRRVKSNQKCSVE